MMRLKKIIKQINLRIKKKMKIKQEKSGKKNFLTS